MNFPDQDGYGIGIGLRVPHYDHILSRRPDVSWFEIISENYLVDGGSALRTLERILEQYRVVQNGVGLYPGNAGGLDRDHLKRLKKLIRRTGTPWISDHLCWGSIDGTYSHDLLPMPYTEECHDLLPMPYTEESVRTISENLRVARDELEIPLAVENVSSYAAFRHDEMSEWEFLAEVVDRADVGILLDVNNIYVSSVNHGFDPMEYVDFIQPERVMQMHIAGHSRYERFIIDTHDHPVIDPVWDLYARAIERCGPTPTLLEWDARIPPFEEVHAEALKARRYWNSIAETDPAAAHEPA